VSKYRVYYRFLFWTDFIKNLKYLHYQLLLSNHKFNIKEYKKLAVRVITKD